MEKKEIAKKITAKNSGKVFLSPVNCSLYLYPAGCDINNLPGEFFEMKEDGSIIMLLGSVVGIDPDEFDIVSRPECKRVEDRRSQFTKGFDLFPNSGGNY